MDSGVASRPENLIHSSKSAWASLEKGIELCIIDTSKLAYFKEKNCLPYLKIITDIINIKI